MSRRTRLLGPLLALATLAAGCQAPGLRSTLVMRPLQASASARLALRLRPKTTYALKYLESRDWVEAKVELSRAGDPVADTTVAAERALDGTRSALATFEGLEAGATYSVAVTLFGRDGYGSALMLGVISQGGTTMAAGTNELTIESSPDWVKATGANPGATSAFLGTAVASFPAAGPGARVREPGGVAQDSTGTLYVADTGNHRILKVGGDGHVEVLAGGTKGFADGDGGDAKFWSPTSLLLVDDDLFVSDVGNHAVRRIQLDADEGPQVSTWAGTGTAGDADGSTTGATPAQLEQPGGLAWDEGTNTLYVADTGNHKIRAMRAGGGEAIVTVTLAGDGEAGHVDDANPLDARFDGPTGLYFWRGFLHVADTNNHVIRNMAVDGAQAEDVGTVLGNAGTPGYADGVGTDASLERPLALVGGGNRAYVYDAGNKRVRELILDETGGDLEVGPYAGNGSNGFVDGALADAGFGGDLGLGFDVEQGLVIADTAIHRVRRVDGDDQVTTVLGDGSAGNLGGDAVRPPAVAAGRVAFFPDGDALVSDVATHRLWRIAADDAPAVFSGTPRASSAGYAEGDAADARFGTPMGLVTDGDGGFFVADADNQVIRHVSATGNTSLIAGGPSMQGGADGDGLVARFKRPWALARDEEGRLYVSERDGHRIRRLSQTSSGSGWEVSTVVGNSDHVGGYQDGEGGRDNEARLQDPVGLAFGRDGILYVADAGNYRIRAVDLSGENPVVSTVAGSGDASSLDGTALSGSFLALTDVAVAQDGTVWAVDGHRLRRVSGLGTADAALRSVAGETEAGYVDGPGPLARFDTPFGLTRGPDDRLWVCDTFNGFLRIVRD